MVEKPKITQEELKRILNYNPETGIFTWKIPNSKWMKVGDIAGCLTSYGYIRIKINHHAYMSHILSWIYVFGKYPENQLDHINNIRNDNRICNLREATSCDNNRHKSMAKSNLSGYKGVVSKGKKWIAQICLNRKVYYLGTFKTPQEAAQVYDNKAKEFFGDFSKLNI